MTLHSGRWFLPAGASGHGTRTAADDAKVKVKSGKLELRRNFFSVRASGQWNSIPSHIKHAKSAKRFKSESQGQDGCRLGAHQDRAYKMMRVTHIRGT